MRAHTLLFLCLLALTACSETEGAQTTPDSPDLGAPMDVSTPEDEEEVPPDAEEDAPASPEDVGEEDAPDDVSPPDEETSPEPEVDPEAFNNARFKSTHNSYSGEERGSLVAQLEGGVRFLELDLHDNDYRDFGDYRVGHDGPGDEVFHGEGNPEGVLLSAWLEVIGAWSAQHPEHAPITLGLDLKDNLMDNPDHASGNLGALNSALERAFGDRLLHGAEIEGAWPGVEALRGRVLVVISGDQGTRIGYRWDKGTRPAVAMNSRGQVVEVHDSGAGTLWYWTGQMGPEGNIEWHRHGRYDTGQDPAVAINDEGWIVEVHQSELRPTLWSRVGRLGEDYEITWSESREFDTGVTPTVRFTDPAGMEVREIHRSEVNPQNWTWRGPIDPDSFTVEWGGHGQTEDPRFDKNTRILGRQRVTVRTGGDGVAPDDALIFETHAVEARRIRYRQVAFVEFQRGNDEALGRDGLWFYAAHALQFPWAGEQRQLGRIVRQWNFNDARLASDPASNFPATDHPAAQWYLDYAAMIGVVE